MYTKIDKNTGAIMSNLFGQSTTARLVGSSKQTGGTDCSLFAIENAAALAFKINPSKKSVQSMSAPCKLYGRKKFFISNDIISYVHIVSDIIISCKEYITVYIHLLIYIMILATS